MLRTLAVTHDLQIRKDIPLQDLSDPKVKWYWVDFDAPSKEEAALLEHYFHFHPLAIEDCLHVLQRPKMDHYEDVQFYVLHSLNPITLEAEEADLFLGKNFIVSFHLNKSGEIDEAWQRISDNQALRGKGPLYCAYLITDKLVDQYFPGVHQIEDLLGEIEGNTNQKSIPQLMDHIFDIRSKLLKIRKTVLPMRDLLYRIINSDRIEGIAEHMFYFKDVYDHLLKLSEMIESNREVTADMRDSYISLNSYRMNTIMKTLTVITTIFMPLTFLAGVYGMNFHYMPELAWHWSYFIVLGVMFGLGVGMYIWFLRKGWFD